MLFLDVISRSLSHGCLVSFNRIYLAGSVNSSLLFSNPNSENISDYSFNELSCELLYPYYSVSMLLLSEFYLKLSRNDLSFFFYSYASSNSSSFSDYYARRLSL